MRRFERIDWWIGVGACVALLGCGSSDKPGDVACTPGQPGCAATSGGSGGAPQQPVAGNTAAAGSGGMKATDGSGGMPAQTAGDGVPCDVAKLVSDHCTLCHGTKLQGSAPMSLMTVADFHADAKLHPGMTVAALAPGRINAATPAARMPPLNSTAALTDPEKATLTAWLSAGAKGVTAGACAITEPAPMVPDAGTDGGAVSGGGLGGASLEEINYDDPDMKCYKFLNHAPGDVNKPYQHGPGEEYVNFTFKAPWTGTVYTRAHKIVLGDAPILHHWLLYIDPSPGIDGGVSGNGSGIHLSSSLLHAWAPGASPLYFDKDVGMKLDGTVGVTLESHINNPTGAMGEDHNGAEICVTSKVPEHIIDLTWTGTESIFGTSASGTCTPSGNEPIHIIAAQPHMHKKGTHMKVVIHRASGMDEIMHDEDFSFDNQRYYLSDKVLMPGDTFSTTCTYNEPASFGKDTSSEMCYWFPFAWPSGSIANSGGIHGPLTCLN